MEVKMVLCRNIAIFHMERYFNIAGPCIPVEHYMLPALDRIPGIRRLVSRRQYFVVHAPRQTGKTTALKALVREINAKGEMAALYCTLETLRDINGGGRITREMAAGSKRLGLCVEFRGHRYAVEVKTSRNFKGDGSFAQLAGYLDTLGLPEGWMAVFDVDADKSWQERLFVRHVAFNGKAIHVVGL